MGLERASYAMLVLMAIATACGGASTKPGADAPQGAPQEVTTGNSAKPPASAATSEPGHTGLPCLVQAATTQLCFYTKEEACASMGCPADRCSYLYKGGAASVVACDD